MATGNWWDYAPWAIIMHPYGYRKLIRLCTLHNYYAPVYLPETDEIMQPAQLLCTRMATGNWWDYAPCTNIMHPYTYRKLLRLCTLHNYYAPVWLPETDEIMHPTQILCTRMATGKWWDYAPCTIIMHPYGSRKLMRLCTLNNYYAMRLCTLHNYNAPAWYRKLMRLCTLHNCYAPVWLQETDEIMHPAQLLCTRMATGNWWDYAPCTNIMHPHGYRKLITLCTVHNCYAPVWLPETDEIMHPAQSLFTRMVPETDEIMHPAQLLCNPYGYRKLMRLCTLHNYYAPVWLPETDEIMHPTQILCTRMATGKWWDYAPCTIIMHPYGSRKLMRLCTLNNYYAMRLCTLHNYNAPAWYRKLMRLCTLHNCYAPVWLQETDEIMHPAQLLCTRMATGNWWDYAPCTNIMHPHGYRKLITLCTVHNCYAPVWLPETDEIMHPAQSLFTRMVPETDEIMHPAQLLCNPYGYRKLMTLCTLHNYYAPIWLPETDEIMHPAQLLCTGMATGNWWDYAPCTIIMHPYGYRKLMRLCTLHNCYAPLWLQETDEIMHPAQILCTRMATGNWWDYAPCTIIIHPYGYGKLMRLCTLHNYYARVWLPETDEIMHPARLLCTRMATRNWWDYAPCTIIMHPYGYQKLMRLCTLHNCYAPVWLQETDEIMHPAQILCTRMATGNCWDYAPCTIIIQPYGYGKLMRLCTLHNYYAPVWLPETDEIMHPARLLCTRMATGNWWDYAPCTIIMHPYGYRKLMRLCTLHNYYAPVWLQEADEIMHPAQILCTRMATGNWWDYAPCTIIMHPYGYRKLMRLCTYTNIMHPYGYQKLITLCTVHNCYAPVWLPETDEIMHPAQSLFTRMVPETDEIMHPAQLLCNPYGYRKLMRLCTLHNYYAPVWLPETDVIMHPAQLLCTGMATGNWWDYAACTIIIHLYGYHKLMRLCTLHNYYAPVWLPETDVIMHPAQLLCTGMATGNWWDYAPCTIIMHPYGYRKLMGLCALHKYYAPVWLQETDEIMQPAQSLFTPMATGNWWDYAPCTIIMQPYGYRKLMRLCTLHNYYAPVWLPETDEIMHPAQLLCTRMATGNWYDYAPCTIIMHPYGYRKLMRLCTLHNYYAPVWVPETDEIMHPAQILCTRMATGNCWDYAPCTIIMHPYGYRKLMRLCTLHNYYAPVWLQQTDEIMHPAQILCTRMATGNWWDYAPCTIIMHPYGYRKLMRLCTYTNIMHPYGYQKLITLCTVHNCYAPVWLPETDEIMHPAQSLFTRMVQETDEIMHPAQLLCTSMATGNWWDYAPCTIIMHPYGYRKLMWLCTLHNYYAPVWLPETDEIMHPAQLLCTRMATENWWDYAPCTIIMHPYGYRKLMGLCTLHKYYAPVWLPETDVIMHPAQLLCTGMATGNWWDYAPCTIIMHPYGYRKLMGLCTLHNYYAPVWLQETDEIMQPAQSLFTPMATGNWWDYAPCTIIMHPYGYRKVMRLCTLHNYYAPVWLPETDEIMHPAQLLCNPYGYRKLMRLCTLHNYYAPVWLPETDEIMHPAQILCTRMATGNCWDYAPCTIIMHPYGYRKLMRLCTYTNIMHPYGYRKLMRSCTLHNYYAPVWLPETDEIMHPTQLLCTRMATGNWWDYAPCTIIMHPYGYRKLMRLCTLHKYYAPGWLPETVEIMHPAQILCTRMATGNWWDYAPTQILCTRMATGNWCDYAPCTIIMHRYGYRKLMRLCTLHNYYAPVWLQKTDGIMHPAQILCTRMATGNWCDYAPCTIIMHRYGYRKLMRLCTLHNYYAPVWLQKTDGIMHPPQLLCTRMATGNWWDYAACTIIIHPYGYGKLMRLCTRHNYYAPLWIPETDEIMHPAQLLCTRMATGNWWDYAPCTIIMQPVWLPETDEIMHPAQLLCTRMATGNWWDYAPCTNIMHPDGYRKLLRLCTLHNYYAPVWLPETDEIMHLHKYYAPVWLPETDEIMHPAQLLCTRMATGNWWDYAPCTIIIHTDGTGNWWDYAPCTIIMHQYGYRKLMRLCTLHNYYAPVWLPETDVIMHPAQLLCTGMATGNWWDYAPCTIIMHPYGYRKLMGLCTLHNYYAPVWLQKTDGIMHPAQILCTRMATGNWCDYAPCTIIMHRYGYRKLMRLCTLHNYYAPVWLQKTDGIMHPPQLLCTRMATGNWWDYAACTIIIHPYGYGKLMRLCTLHNYYAPLWIPESDEIMHPAQLLCTRMATGNWWDYAPCTIIMQPVWLPETDEIMHPAQLLCTRMATGNWWDYAPCTNIMHPDGYRKLLRLCTLHNYYAPVWLPETDEIMHLHKYYAPVWLPETDEIMHPAQLLCTGMATGNWWDYAPYTIIMHPYGYRKLMRLCTLHNYYAPVWLPETDEIMHPAQILCTRMATGNCWDYAPCTIIMHPYGYRKLMRLCTYTNIMHPYGYRKLMWLCTLHNYYAPVWLPETDEIMHPAQLLCTRMATENWWDYAPCTNIMHPYGYRKLMWLCTLHNYYAPVWLPETDEIMHPAQLLCTRMATENWWDYAPSTIIMHPYGYRKLMRLCSLHNHYSPLWLRETDEIMHPAQLLCTPMDTGNWWDYAPCTIIMHPYGYRKLMRLCTLHNYYATRMATGNWWDYAPCTIIMHPYGYRKLMRLCTLHKYYAPGWLPETVEIMHPAQLLCTRMATGNWWDYAPTQILCTRMATGNWWDHAPCTIIMHPYGYRKLMRLCTLHNYYATRMATGNWWDYAPCTNSMHPYGYRKQ